MFLQAIEADLRINGSLKALMHSFEWSENGIFERFLPMVFHRW